MGPIYHLTLATQTGIVQRFESDTGPSLAPSLLPVWLVKVGIGADGWNRDIRDPTLSGAGFELARRQEDVFKQSMNSYHGTMVPFVMHEKNIAYNLEIHATTQQSFLMMSYFKISSIRKKELVCQVLCFPNISHSINRVW